MQESSLHNRKAVFVSWGNDLTWGGGHIAIRQLLARHIHVSWEIHSTNRVPAIKTFSCFGEIIWYQYPAFETSSIILHAPPPHFNFSLKVQNCERSCDHRCLMLLSERSTPPSCISRGWLWECVERDLVEEGLDEGVPSSVCPSGQCLNPGI